MKRLIPSVVFGLALLLLPGLAWAQQGTVTGTVTEAETGNPLPGATVQIVGEGTGAATDANGQYNISGVPSGQQTVQVSFVGYQSEERTLNVPAGGTVRANFQLQATEAELEEVVVTGVSQGTETQKLGYAVSKVDADQLEEVPATNPANSLRGTISGVRIVQPSGEPGSTPRIRLRGTVSITGSQDPLIVVDGAITQGSLEDIDMQNVKSIEVVKGAAAASLYGSLGANGVVQIITEKGKTGGGTRVTVRNEVGFSQLANKLDLATHHNRGFINDQGEVVNQYRPDPSQSESCTAAPCTPYSPLPGSLNVVDNAFSQTFDQQEELYTPQPFYTNYVSFSGSQEDLNYLVSFENLNQGGVIERAEGYKRRNFRVNVGNQVTDWWNVNVSSLYSRQSGLDIDEQGQGDNVFYGTLLAAPDLDLDASAPDSIDAPVNPFVNSSNASNPLYTLATNNDDFQDERILGNISTTFDLTDWLTVDGQFGYDREENTFSNSTRVGTLPASPTGSPSQGFISQNTSTEVLKTARGRVLLSQEFSDLTTELTGTYFYEEREQQGFNASGSQFFAKDVPQLDNSDPSTLNAGSFSRTIRAENISANLVLDYKDRYILDAVVRRDGLSLFGEEARYQTYFRLTGTYRLTQDFDIPGVGQLKLRGNYGTAGDRPPFAAQYETFQVTQSGISKQRLGNEDIEPVNLTEWTAGVDVAFLNRFQFSATYSDSKSSNQVLEVPLSAAAGFNTQFQNAGTIESSSIEMNLRGTILDREKLTLDAGLTFSSTSQEVTELGRPPFTRNIGSAIDLFRIGEGVPVGAIYGNQLATSIDQLRFGEDGGLNGYESQVSGTDDVLTRDDLMINDEGYVIERGTQYTSKETAFYVTNSNGQRVTKKIGNSIPDFSMGLNTSLSYGNWSLYALADWEKGGDVYNYTKQLLIFNERAGVVDQADKPEGKRHNLSYYLSGPYNQSNPSSYFVENGSYLKLREVSVGYTFSNDLLQRIGIGDQLQTAELNVSGRNLFTITPYSGYDPEVSVQSGDGDTQPTNFKVDDFGYPNFRNYTFSLEFKF
ncbi:MAG: SusC/RagA family TonB-linked outer membrane protein [Salinibacter sp.]